METGPFPDARRLIIVPVTRLDFKVAPLEPNSPHSVDSGTSWGKMGALKDYQRYAMRCLEEARAAPDVRLRPSRIRPRFRIAGQRS